MIRDECLEKHAASLYSNNLPYHNFQHVEDVLTAGDHILSECKKNGIEFDESIIYHAILFHDAGYHENQKEKGFDYKESYSASLAEAALTDKDYSSDHICQVKQAIMATHINGQCKSTEDYIVRAADLSGLMAAYPDFLEKSVALYHEKEIMSGLKISWDEYKNEAFAIINNFVKHQIKLDISLYEDGKDRFRQKVYKNLDLLMVEKAV